MDGALVVEPFESRVLRGNPLGDPHVRDLPIYLPPSYRRDGARRFPVCYCLTGFTGKGSMLLNVRPWGETIIDQYERLLAAGKTREMLLVMPDAFTRYGGSQYVNSSATGRYEDYIAREIPGYIDRQFRTIAGPQGRAVMGKSSGGYGSMIHGMRHPDVFGLVACHSGDMYFDYCYIMDIPRYLNGLRLHRHSTQKFLKAFARMRKKPSSAVMMMNIAAMSACYSPNPKNPVGFDLPFDEFTGRINLNVWKRWLRWDPVRMLGRYAKSLRQLRLLFIDCGWRDQFQLHFGARIFVERLKELKVHHLYEEFDDDHTDISYRYDRSLSLIGRKFGRR